MTITMTEEQMIRWVQNHPVCSSSDLPDWLLDLAQTHQDIEGGEELYRDLMAVAHLRSLALSEGWISLTLEDMREEIVEFLNRLDFVISIERMRRKTNGFKIHIGDVFSLNDETIIVISQSDGEGSVVSLSEIMSEFDGIHDDEDKGGSGQ